MSSLVIAGPVRQRPDILSHFLASLRRLETPGIDVSFELIDDNDDDASRGLLAEFSRETGAVVLPAARGATAYVTDAETHRWTDELVWRVARFKDELLDRARAAGTDHVLLVDSDLVLHPRTVQVLLAAEKDIVSEVFWTAWQPGGLELPQVWLCDTYSMHDARHDGRLDDAGRREHALAFVARLKHPGVYRVGGLGACTLVSRKALQLGVRFERLYNLSFPGEDRHFCIRAAALGLELFVDTHVPALHLYRPEDVGRVPEFLERCA